MGTQVDRAIASLALLRTLTNLTITMAQNPTARLRTAAHNTLDAVLSALQPEARLAAIEQLLGEAAPAVSALLLHRLTQEIVRAAEEGAGGSHLFTCMGLGCMNE